MAGIDCDTTSLTDGSCTMNTNSILGINPKDKNLKDVSQDLIGGFTMFIGFVVLIALVYSGVLMIFGGADEKKFETGKKGVIYSIIGLLLVGGAYGIIRLVQLLAK